APRALLPRHLPEAAPRWTAAAPARRPAHAPPLRSPGPHRSLLDPQRMITLDIQSGQHRGARVQLGGGDKAAPAAPAALTALTIGRGGQNQLVLGDYHLSTEHGQI